MNYFDLAQSFIERCEAAADIDDIAAAFRRTVEALGFRHFACCSHADPLRPPRRAVVVHTYPEEWARIFSERQLVHVDPVFRHADRTLLPFFWDAGAFQAGLTRQQREILAEASRFGLVHGYTIPIHSPCPSRGLRASCSVVPDSVSLDPRSYHTVQLMACYMYESASRHGEAQEPEAAAPELSLRERQCLELAAQGKSDWVAAKLLGVSVSTAHNHIESAKRRLGVATRTQAIVHALASRQISFGDVIRSQPAPPPRKPKSRRRV